MDVRISDANELKGPGRCHSLALNATSVRRRILMELYVSTFLM